MTFPHCIQRRHSGGSAKFMVLILNDCVVSCGDVPSSWNCSYFTGNFPFHPKNMGVSGYVILCCRVSPSPKMFLYETLKIRLKTEVILEDRSTMCVSSWTNLLIGAFSLIV